MEIYNDKLSDSKLSDIRLSHNGFEFPIQCVRLIFEQMGVTAITNKDGVYVYVNRQWERDTGLSRGDVIGKYSGDVIEDSKAITAIKSKKIITAEFGIILKSKKKLPGIISYMPICHNDIVMGCFISSAFMNKDQATEFSKRFNHIQQKNEYLEGEMIKRSGAKYSLDNILGKSPAILKLKDQVSIAGASNATVLLEGETGTGKELVAHAIHRCSSRNIFPFIRTNCSAIPENLMEAEFFGYEEGSFTGALTKGKTGKFEDAEMGSLFLDEINHLSPAMQPKLLRVLQEKEIERIGKSESIPINVHIIAASSQSLKKMCEEGLFRFDLYYRLNIIHIAVPPLRNRKEDIPILIDDMIKRWNSNTTRPIFGVSDAAVKYLMRQDWPGNVRELQNAFEQAANTSTEGILDISAFKNEFVDMNSSGYTRHPYNESVERNLELKEQRANFERDAIITALSKSGGNKSKAAGALSISRTLLYKKIKKYGL